MFHFLPSKEVMLNLPNFYADTLVKSIDLWSWHSLNITLQRNRNLRWIKEN